MSSKEFGELLFEGGVIYIILLADAIVYVDVTMRDELWSTCGSYKATPHCVGGSIMVTSKLLFWFLSVVLLLLLLFLFMLLNCCFI